jgi:dATP pyrophosphohydrolase
VLFRSTPSIAPDEHLAWQWLPWQAAADLCFSPSNAQAIRDLARDHLGQG